MTSWTKVTRWVLYRCAATAANHSWDFTPLLLPPFKSQPTDHPGPPPVGWFYKKRRRRKWSRHSTGDADGEATTSLSFNGFFCTDKIMNVIVIAIFCFLGKGIAHFIFSSPFLNINHLFLPVIDKGQSLILPWLLNNSTRLSLPSYPRYLGESSILIVIRFENLQ